MNDSLESIPGVCDVRHFGPADNGVPVLLIELPHGATTHAHYEALTARMQGKLPDELEAFFFVNTDVGTPECAWDIAKTMAGEGIATVVLRCLLPRTLMDCNRVVSEGPNGSTMTAAIPEYVTDERDRQLLIELQKQYHELTASAYRQVMNGAAPGLALQLHSYAPKSVFIDNIDDGIVAALRHAYTPAQYAKWQDRPQVELITETQDGRHLAPAGALDSVRINFEDAGITVAENETYRLHAETWGFRYADAYPGRVLCVELNRGLLATPFSPFEEMVIGSDEAARLARPLAQTCRELLTTQ